MMYAKVIQSGNSAVVTIPKRFREKNDIMPGDRILIDFPNESTMIVRPLDTTKNNKLALLEELKAIAKDNAQGSSFPMDSQEDRAMLADRDV